LKFNLGFGDSRVDGFKPLIKHWHDAVWPRTSRSKTFDDSWDNFVESWEGACVPLGGDLAALAFDLARTDPVPPSALAAFTDPKRHLLAAACRRLQLMVGDSDFSLSARQVAKGLGLEGDTAPGIAHRLLKGLCMAQILQCAFRGTPGPGGKDSAARWRYIVADLRDFNQHAGHLNGSLAPPPVQRKVSCPLKEQVDR
jgi:hypothetical protein